MQNAEPQISPVEAESDTVKRGRRSAMMIVFLVVFIDLLGFGIVLPLLPRIADSYVKTLYPAGGWRVGMIVGLLMSSFSLMQFIFAPMWGRLSDRVGRRPVLLIGLFASVVFYSLFGYALSLPPKSSASLAIALFFASRIGAGIAGATISTAQAVIADSTPPEKRKHGMALIGAAFGIGFTFGPLIGFACLSIQDYHPLIGYVAASLSLIAWLLGLRLLPETRILGQASAARRSLVQGSALKFALFNPAISPVILTFFLASLGFGAFEVTLAVFLRDVFGFGDNQSFLFFAYVGFVLMLTQGVFYRKLASRVSEVTFMAYGILFMAVGVALLGGISWWAWSRFQQDALPVIGASTVGLMASPGEYGPLLAASAVLPGRIQDSMLLPFLFLALTSAVVGFAFLTPSAQALISRRTPDDRQGEILGVNQSASAMARILGPVFGLSLYTATDSHLLPYIAGAVLLVLMFPMLPRIRRGGPAV